MERLTPRHQFHDWVAMTKREERVRLNALLEGITDGHTYSARTNAPANPIDGMLMYFAANAVGSEAGFYGRINGEWKLIPQTALLPAAMWSINTVGADTYLHPVDLTTHMLVGSDSMPTALNLDIANAKLAIDGTPLTNEGDLQALGSGVLALKETTTPTADADHAKVYSKSDNKLYYQDGAGSEHALVDSGHTVVSHDTDGTGAELTELTDGSETTLHSHASPAPEGAADAYDFLPVHSFEASWPLSTPKMDSNGYSYIGMPDNAVSYVGRTIKPPEAWDGSETLYYALWWAGEIDPGEDPAGWRCDVAISGTDDDEAPPQATVTASQTLEVKPGDPDYATLTKTVFTISPDVDWAYDELFAIKITRQTGHEDDEYDDDIRIYGVEPYVT